MTERQQLAFVLGASLIVLILALLAVALFSDPPPQGPEQRMHDALGGVR